MIVYYAGSELTRPEAVECKESGYPNCDATGRVMYENTHFALEGEAWERLRREHKAGVSLSSSAVREIRRRLLEAEARLVEDALIRDECDHNFEDWCESTKVDQ